METAAIVEGIRRYTIHGEPYAIVYYSRDGDRDTILQTQISEDALPARLRVGDVIIITFIGSVVAGVRRG